MVIAANRQVQKKQAPKAPPAPKAAVAQPKGAAAGDGSRVDLSLSARSLQTNQQLAKGWNLSEALTDKSVFNAEFYADKYPDLAAHGVKTASQLKAHWLKHGIKEGRQGSSTFSSTDYLRNYSDLGKAGLESPLDGLRHWLVYGQKEGRSGLSDIQKRPEAYTRPEVFNPEYYAEQNPDLGRHGVTTEKQLREHWLTHGIREGRQGSAAFNAEWYLDRYPDLRRAGIKTNEAALRHYNDHGKAEGRLTSALTSDVPLNGDLKMDIYRPAKTDGKKVPVVINMVGGGWQSADKSHPVMQHYGKEFAERGIAMVAPEYHTAPKAQYPAQLNDVSEVLKYVKKHAAENNWDLNNITLMGGSAGGHLALQHAMNPRFDSNSALPEVKNVIAVSPATDLTVDLKKDAFKENDGFPDYIGSFLGTTNRRAEVEASPLSYASLHSDKRFYLAYGEKDILTTAQDQARPFVNRMRAFGNDLAVKSYANGGHGDWQHPAGAVYDPGFVGELAHWISQG